MVLSIVNATYGDHEGGSVADVTEAVSKGLDEKHLRLRLDVNEGTMGGQDPAPGKVKSLKIVYTGAEGGEQKEVMAGERTTVDILADSQPGYYWPVDGPLKIVEARYGDPNNPDRTVDKTEEARQIVMDKNGYGLEMMATHGSDPAPGTAKKLKVKYTDSPDGEIKEAESDEGFSMNLEAGDPNAPPAPPAEAPPAPPAEAPPAEAVPVESAPEPVPEAAPVPVPTPETEKVEAAAGGQGHALEWKSADGQIYVNGRPFNLKGINWHGLETESRRPEGLDKTSAREYLDFLASNGFNAVRLPISASFATDLEGSSKDMPDGELQGLSNGQLLEKIVDMCGERGMVVVVSMDRLTESKPAPELWYDENFSTEAVMHAWDMVLDNLQGKWNFMGVDIKNEPHGTASWGGSNPSYDWNHAAEQLCNHLVESHQGWRGLFFVQGVSEANNVDTDSRSPHPSWHGGNLQGVQKHPISLSDPNQNNARVVYSPKVWGPSIFEQEYFKRGDFPGCMWEVWGQHFGFVKDATGRAVVPAEWGGWYNSEKDCTWHNCMVDFMTQNGLHGSFYSGGVLGDDWRSPVGQKLELLSRLQPNPHRLKASGAQVFIQGPEGEQEI